MPDERQLAMARQRVDALTRSYLALEHDRDAFQQGLELERARRLEADRGEVALALLEALDGLDLALASADGSPLAQGVQVVRRAWGERAQRLGLERVPLLGTVFDPALAEEVETVPTADAEQHHRVVAEVLPAYRLKDRLLQPGRVKVARYTPG